MMKFRLNRTKIKKVKFMERILGLVENIWSSIEKDEGNFHSVPMKDFCRAKNGNLAVQCTWTYA